MARESSKGKPISEPTGPILPSPPMPGDSAGVSTGSTGTYSSGGSGGGFDPIGRASAGADMELLDDFEAESYGLLPDVRYLDGAEDMDDDSEGMGDALISAQSGTPYDGSFSPAPVSIPSPSAPSIPASSGFDFSSAIANVTNAAFQILRVQQAYRAAREPQVRTVTVAANGVTRTANTDGTVTLRDVEGRIVGNERPSPGIPYAMPDGSVIINNGNGTYTTINPAGVRSVKSYGAASGMVVDGFGSSLGFGIAGAALIAGLAYLALRGRR